MRIVDVNWDPSRAQLRQFGIGCLFALPTGGWLLGLDLWAVGLAGVIGLALALSSWLHPRVLRPLFIGWTVLFLPLAVIVGELALLVTYFGLFVPIGLMLRLTGRDTLRRSIDRDATSYWTARKKTHDATRYFRQS
jgi:hypothetical protein